MKNGDFKLYKKKDTYRVKAKQMNEPFEVKTLEGTMKGKKGDYLLEGTRKEKWVVDKKVFESTFIEA